MKKLTGIWLDFKGAFLVETMEDEPIKTCIIPSGISPDKVGGGSRTGGTPWGPMNVVSESKILAKRKQEETAYFENIMNAVNDADEVVIFGPGEAKEGLAKSIQKARKQFHPMIRGIKTTDKMTPRQKISFVKRFYDLSLTCIAFLCFAVIGFAQTDESLFAGLVADENTAMEAIALYPQTSRENVLEVSLFPEALLRLEANQKEVSRDFKALAADYPQSVQEMLWDLSRYPRLISQLAALENSPEESVNALLSEYPLESRVPAKDMWRRYPKLLQGARLLTERSDQMLAQILSGYPLRIQTAVKELIELPELLTILTGNTRLVVILGDLYRRNPDRLHQMMDDYARQVAEKRSKELKDWKDELETNPDAKQELIASTKDFVGDYTYDDMYYNGDYHNDSPEEAVVVQYHYPYWFGYPYWYVYPRWRPYPYWYDWGFYWGPGHVIVIIDLPSPYFTHWYFYHPRHHYHYPHLSSQFANHYYGHRNSGSSITAGVGDWKINNRDLIDDDWIDRARNNKEQFKEYGKLELDREQYNRAHRDHPMTSEAYLDKNKEKYPEMKKNSRSTPTRDDQIKNDEPPVVTPRKTPRTEPRKTEQTTPEKSKTTPTKRKDEAVDKKPPVTPPKESTDKQQGKAVKEPRKTTTEPPKTTPDKTKTEQKTAPRKKDGNG